MGTDRGMELIDIQIKEAEEKISQIQAEILEWQNIRRELGNIRLENMRRNLALQLDSCEKMETKPRFPSMSDGIWEVLKGASSPMTTTEIVEALKAIGEDRADIHNVGTALRRAFRAEKVCRTREPGGKTRWALMDFGSPENQTGT